MGGVTGSEVDSFLTQRHQQADTCDGRGHAESFIITATEAVQTKAQAQASSSAGAGNTFGPVAPVLLLPLVQQDVLVPRTLEEAKVAGR